MTGPTRERPTHIWVVDRIEGEAVILVEDETGRSAEVTRALLGTAVREGSVLHVPVSSAGRLEWGEAYTDPEEEWRRREEAVRILRKLKARDPGGDVSL